MKNNTKIFQEIEQKIRCQIRVRFIKITWIACSVFISGFTQKNRSTYYS